MSDTLRNITGIAWKRISERRTTPKYYPRSKYLRGTKNPQRQHPCINYTDVVVKYRINKPLKNVQNNKIENIVGSVRSSLVMDARPP